MSRISRESPEETSDARFQRVLAEVQRAGENRKTLSGEDDEPSNFPVNPLAGAIFSMDDYRRRTTGGGSHWDAALAWIEERDEPAAMMELPHQAGESAEAIVDELGLSDNLTYDELNQVRRLYMWRNHPDRHSEAQRERATRRVAIANMLVDRAQARLISGRRT